MPVQVYLSYREDDAGPFVFHFTREFERAASDIRLTPGAVTSGGGLVAPSEADVILLLVGRRWLRAQAGEPSFLSDPGDPVRVLLETAQRVHRRIVPVLFQIPTSEWHMMGRNQFPRALRYLALLHAVEVRPASFALDLQAIIAGLRSGDGSIPWTEGDSRSVIRIEAVGGGPLKAYFNLNESVRVFVDGIEVGTVAARNGAFDWSVEPGRHTVHARSGRLSPKSELVTVDVARGQTVALVCDRNIITTAVSLKRRE